MMFAVIAQLGERQTEDLKVPGSIPGLGNRYLFVCLVIQLVVVAALIEVYYIYYVEELLVGQIHKARFQCKNLMCTKLQAQFTAYQKHEVLMYIYSVLCV